MTESERETTLAKRPLAILSHLRPIVIADVGLLSSQTLDSILNVYCKHGFEMAAIQVREHSFTGQY